MRGREGSRGLGGCGIYVCSWLAKRRSSLAFVSSLSWRYWLVDMMPASDTTASRALCQGVGCVSWLSRDEASM